MTSGPSANEAQRAYWNAAAGETWAGLQALLDRQIAPLGLAAMDRLGAKAAEHILDIGCGCGQTSLELARRVGPEGRVLGVDISTPMLEIARQRAAAENAGAHLAFLEADAQTHDFGAGSFDAAFSRFGVMFFEDPAAAFANIVRALKPGGRLAFVCWRPIDLNGWMTIPMTAAKDMIPAPQPPVPGAPGPFAFADPERVRAILAGAGLEAIGFEARDTLIGGNSLEDTLRLSLRVGPLAAVLREDPSLVPRVTDAVLEAIRPYDTPKGVFMPGSVWIVEARKP